MAQATITLTLIRCEGNHFFTAKFYGSVDQAQDNAVRWLEPRRSYCAIAHQDCDIPDEALRLWAVVDPICEHGLSAQLCSGPNHYETYDQERRREGF